MSQSFVEIIEKGGLKIRGPQKTNKGFKIGRTILLGLLVIIGSRFGVENKIEYGTNCNNDEYLNVQVSNWLGVELPSKVEVVGQPGCQLNLSFSLNAYVQYGGLKDNKTFRIKGRRVGETINVYSVYPKDRGLRKVAASISSDDLYSTGTNNRCISTSEAGLICFSKPIHNAPNRPIDVWATIDGSYTIIDLEDR